MSKVLIVDDHALVRDGLRTVLAVTIDQCELFEASDLDEAVKIIDREGDFDLLLLDLNMPGVTGFNGLQALRARYSFLPVVIVSASCDRRLVEDALRHGAAGFIPKSLPRSQIAEALRTILKGDIYMPDVLQDPPSVDDKEDQEILRRIASLTPQQRRVLELIVIGKLNKEIAYELDVTETTVKAHVSAILQKLRVFSRTQAVILANKVQFPDTHPVPTHPGVERRQGL